MKARVVHAAVQRTEHVFTDREEPRRAFWAAYDRVSADLGSVETISYYGVGGIGKSSLLFQLIRELKERAPQTPRGYYSFELSGRNKDDCLYFLAECLMQQCKELQFPLFSAALLRLNQLAGRDVADLEKRMAHSLLDRSEVTAALNIMGAFIPNFSAARIVGETGLKLFKALRNDYERKEGPNAPFYREIEESGAAELMNNLQKYFCMDAASCLERQTPPVVIMLDGYEVLTNTLERGDLAEVEDMWLWGREGIVWSLPNTLWVIAGRNRLAWDRYDGELSDSLEQHLLGNLSEADAAGFLRSSGVKEEGLYPELYRLTGGTPVYLDVCVNTYRQLKAVRGESYVPVIDDFGSNPASLAERFLRGMNGEHQRVTKLIACLPANWTEELVMDAAESAGYASIRGAFDDVCRLSLIEKDGGRSKLHSTLRAVARRFMDENERRRLDNTVFRVLVTRMEDPELRAEREDHAAWAAELLACEDTGINAGEDDLRAVLQAAASCNDRGDYRGYFEYVQQVTAYVQTHPCGVAALALCREHQFKALLNLGRYREAMVPGQEAYDLCLRLHGLDHPDTLYNLNNLAIGHSRLGDWQKAMELTRTVYDARVRIHGSNHEGTVACLNNMAIYSVQMGDYEGAADLMHRSCEAMLRLLGPEHPHTIICQNNLAAVYNKLGEYRKATELLQQVYDTQLRTLGADHPDLLFSIFNLAVGCGETGEYERALQLAVKAYDAHLRILGSDHPDTLAALNYLAESHLNVGDRDEAVRLARQALDGRVALLGAEHPDVAESRALLERCN